MYKKSSSCVTLDRFSMGPDSPGDKITYYIHTQIYYDSDSNLNRRRTENVSDIDKIINK